MSSMVVSVFNQNVIVSSWTDGIVARHEPTLFEEAMKCPQAVGARLLNDGNIDGAVEVIEVLCLNNKFEQAQIVDGYFK